jgi:hypothetical protein
MSSKNSLSIEVQLSQLDNTKAYQKETLCVSSTPLIDVEPQFLPMLSS